MPGLGGTTFGNYTLGRPLIGGLVCGPMLYPAAMSFSKASASSWVMDWLFPSFTAPGRSLQRPTQYPCTGLIAVNDKAASTPVLKAAYKNASDKKTFVWTLADWQAKKEKVLASQDQYFLIAKNPVDMAKVLLDQPFDPGTREICVIVITSIPFLFYLGGPAADSGEMNTWRRIQH